MMMRHGVNSFGSRALRVALQTASHRKESFAVASVITRRNFGTTPTSRTSSPSFCGTPSRRSLHATPARYFASLPDHVTVNFPSVSPTMETGTLISWHKQEGEAIKEGDLLCEIQSDKSTMPFEAPDDGFLAKIYIPDDSKEVPVGRPMCVICYEESDLSAFKDLKEPSSASETPSGKSVIPNAPSGPSSGAPKAPGAPVKSLPEHMTIKMPSLSPTMESGTLVAWLKDEGDAVKEGEILCEIQTDKAVMVFESPEDGFLARILVPADTPDIPLGKPICILVFEQASIFPFANYSAPADEPKPAPAAPPSKPASSPPTPTQPAKPMPTSGMPVTPPPPKSFALHEVGGPLPPAVNANASPLARMVASTSGVDLASLKGTGPDGMIRASDVLAAAVSAPAQPAPTRHLAPPSTPGMVTTSGVAKPASFEAGLYVDVPVSNVRGIIAKRLQESKQTIPHYYLTIECSLDKVLSLRKSFNEQLSKDGVKISVNDFVIKAASMACLQVPQVNSSWMGSFIRQFSSVDVSVAVATEDGLITPIVFDAHSKGLVSISSDVTRLAAKARANKLQPSEFQGGTFTISNLGMYGIKSFTAIINPPQSCILAVGGPQKHAPTTPDAQPTTTFHVTLSCDHRVVDGAVGAQWLQFFKKYIEDPNSMLL